MSAVEEITNKYKKAGWSIEWFDFIDETRRQSLFHDGTYALATKTINGNTYGVAYYTEGRVSASLTDAQGRKLIKANGEDNRKNSMPISMMMPNCRRPTITIALTSKVETKTA